jgi:glutamyl-tRNA synthetase
MMSFVFSDELAYEPETLISKGMTREQAILALDEAYALLSNIDDFDEPAIERALRAKADELDIKLRRFLGTLRVALSGRQVSLPLFGSIAILGRRKVLDRLARARSLLV